MSSWAPFIMLLLLAVIAHGRNSVPNHNAQDFSPNAMTIRGDIKAANTNSLDDVAVANTFAVEDLVENWSFACKELCGAKAGDTSCPLHCTNRRLKRERKRRRRNILKGTLNLGNDDICKDLCSIKRGFLSCNCLLKTEMFTNAKAESTKKACNIICGGESKTQLDCSPCREDLSDRKQINEQIGKNGIIKYMDEEQVQTTTPDWDQLCQSLCKTGDGGSLCNCDLSPFLNSFLK